MSGEVPLTREVGMSDGSGEKVSVSCWLCFNEFEMTREKYEQEVKDFGQRFFCSKSCLLDELGY